MSEIKVLFVCLGNICRSPTAEGVFRSKIIEAGLEEKISIDSAGTGDWHIGRSPDPRAQEHAASAGYDISDLRARLVAQEDFQIFDYILAMDQQNLLDLQAMRTQSFDGHLSLFLDFYKGSAVREVPDPYYGGDEAFQEVIQLVERGSDALIHDICQRFNTKLVK